MGGGSRDRVVQVEGCTTSQATCPERPTQPDLAAPTDRAFTFDEAGRFDYQGRVGAGGMGTVHAARDRTLLREVAIKVLAPGLASDPKHVKRFMAEAQIQAQLDHPNIVPVHDLVVHSEDAKYFTMRLVRGRTLADWIIATHSEPAPPETLREMLGVFLKVCDAVAFAHSRGVLHLDMKPENIIVEDFGAVYLMDWGLSRLMSPAPGGGPGVTISPEAEGALVSGVIGSPSYMSPEQAMGTAGVVTERTDVFGLGAVLYAILAGRPPYVADSLNEVLEKARNGDRPALPRSPRGVPVPARICHITMRALANDPADRHASVVDLKRDVEAFLQGKLAFPVQTFVPGERIVSEGEHGDSAYVIEKGTCVAYTASAGTCSTLRELSAGNVFGEEVVFSPGPRACTVEATTEVSARVVTHRMIEEGLGRDSWFGAFIMALADRLRRA